MPVQIDVNDNWRCCRRSTSDDDHLVYLLTESDVGSLNCFPVTLPHTPTLAKENGLRDSVEKWWYYTQLQFIRADQLLKRSVFVTFRSSDASVPAPVTVWFNTVKIFSGTLAAPETSIELPGMDSTGKPTLVVCCLNHCLSFNASLTVPSETMDSVDSNEKREDTAEYEGWLEETLERETLQSKDPLAIGSQSKIPLLTIVMLVVGTRGDVQPFIAYGKALRAVGHRVRLATHEKFRRFVQGHGLEFFPLATDPAEIMSFLVENSGAIPSLAAMLNGNLLQRRRLFSEILDSTWLACITPDEETGLPFRAEAIIANPISFGHIHCAQKLRVPLHMVFTMPSLPTVAFPSPLSGVAYTAARRDRMNVFSYTLIETLMWWGIGDLINEFRREGLNLPALDVREATSLLIDAHIPHTFCWSPSLVPKPSDWPFYAHVSGYFFLERPPNVPTPSGELLRFLGLSSSSESKDESAELSPPIFIGFGSVFGHDAQNLLQIVLAALRQTGQRALLSGFAAESEQLPPSVLQIGDVPYDWLFPHVFAVCHHGGAGTTADGLRAGKPTIVMPFFGDQFFWGSVIERSGAGPPPLPGRTVTVEKLVEALRFVQQPSVHLAARRIQAALRREDGCAVAVQTFHDSLPLSRIRSDLEPTFAACLSMEELNLKVSRPVAQVLLLAGVASESDFRHHPTQDWLMAGTSAEESHADDRLTLLESRAERRDSADLAALLDHVAKRSGFSPPVCQGILLQFLKLKRQRRETSVYSPMNPGRSARSTLRQSQSFFDLFYLPVILANFLKLCSRTLVSVFFYNGNPYL